MTTNEKVIIFDLGGVLAHDTYNIMIEQLLPNSDGKLVSEILKNASKWFAVYKVGDIEEDCFFKNTLTFSNDLFLKELHLHKHIEELNVDEGIHFLKKRIREHHCKVFPKSIEFLKNYKKNYPNISLGILSNHTKDWFWYIWDTNSELKEIFHQKDLVVVSCDDDVKCAKPDAKAFEALWRRIQKVHPNILKENIVFIDDKDRNVQVAKKFGFTSFTFNAYHDDITQLEKILK